MTVRYGAIASALASLRGAPNATALAPTAAAISFRARVGRGIPPLADLYVPPRPTGASVVLVHGGAFLIGSRRMKPMRFLAARLASAGIGVCAIDYRMIFRGGRLDEAIDDVRAAVAFWREQAPAHGLDPAAISLIGLSAGASLAMLATAELAPDALAGLVCCFGLYELDELRGAAAVLPRLLLRTRDRAIWAVRSPSRARQPATPTLLLHGTADGLVPADQARRLAAHRATLGLPTRLVVYPDAPHGFFNLPCAAADAGVAEIIAHVGAPGAARR